MNRMPVQKYRPFRTVELPDRRWPSQRIAKAPVWCSVDLRDGNQALEVPMNIEEKLELFRLLADIGFREIEVGFPSASKVEYDFMRMLITEDRIPDQVTIQVLTQAREGLITKTFSALEGVRRAIVHMYNSTSELQRRVVFGKGRQEIIGLAVRGAGMIREQAERLQGADIIFEYSPESFTGTEPDFAAEICEAVLGIWEPGPGRTVILNLPATVEMFTPNLYADTIEWFCRKISNREGVIISVHTHNDRGTAVAASELALLAGADRVEGTLFGNGERTGNVDIVTLAMNLFAQGIDPELDFHDMNRIIGTFERCTRMPVPMRHPYAGALVYTAFSGSHQDAISKGMKYHRDHSPDTWEVPYLPIDPADVGRTYESIIRINSQSGKGGVAYVMEKQYGCLLPKEMHPEFGAVVQAFSDRTGKEVTPEELIEVFRQEYLLREGPLALLKCSLVEDDRDVRAKALLRISGEMREAAGSGNGPIDAFCTCLKDALGIGFRLSTYHEHALSSGSDAQAAAYVSIEDGSGKVFFGVGVDANIDMASFKAVVSALNRSHMVAGV